MGKYIVGIDIQQNMMICIPVEGSIIYPDLAHVKASIPESAQEQRKQVNTVIKWLQDNKAPQNLCDFIASHLGSQIDKTFDFTNAEIMVNNDGVLYTLKNVKIIDGIDEVLKIKMMPS